MNKQIPIAMMIVGAAWLVRPAGAQDAANEADAPAPAAESARSPMPSEEVMRPTEHGVRMTPRLARALSNSFVSKLAKEDSLSPDQAAQLNQLLSKRIMETARTNQELAQGAVEYVLNTFMNKEMKRQELDAESAREFGRRLAPVAPVLKEFLTGAVDDFEPVLGAAKHEELRKEMGKALDNLDQFENRMKRWADGDYKPGEHPFEDRPPASEKQEETPPKNPELVRAEQHSNYVMMTLEPTTWERFSHSAAKFFKFDEQQQARAGEILADYQARADQIMTPEWKNRIRENRLKQQFRNTLNKDQPVAPWFFHLQYEFDQANKPLRELGKSFREEVLALVTEEQRQAALEQVRSRASEHGLEIEPADLAFLRLGDGPAVRH